LQKSTNTWREKLNARILIYCIAAGVNSLRWLGSWRPAALLLACADLLCLRGYGDLIITSKSWNVLKNTRVLNNESLFFYLLNCSVDIRDNRFQND
jgi:hypothetical protein